MNRTTEATTPAATESAAGPPERLHTPTRNAPLSRQVADQIGALIAAGDWPVGTRVPPEHELVQRLGVSRNTVREALRALVYLGLLDSRPGDGTYVRAANELQSSLLRRADRDGTAEIFEVRALLERHAARLAAQRRRRGDPARLRALLARQQELESDAAQATEAVRADAELHRAIVQCAGNSLLTELYDGLGSVRAESVTEALRGHGHAAEQRRQHLALIEAIADRDADAAERAAGAIVAESARAADSAARRGAGARR